MPVRKVPLVTREYYHIYNRGVAKQPIFTNARHYQRFINTLLYYSLSQTPIKYSQFDPLKHLLNQHQKRVQLICYCLMPNHFHLLLRQLKDGGITDLMGNLGNSYTKYYNTKELRVGPLLQGVFKSIRVETDGQLLHLSRYIHLNPLVNFIVKNLSAYKWSSYPEYIGLTSTKFCNKKVVLDQFAAVADYRRFVLDQEDYAKELENIKHQAVDL